VVESGGKWRKMEKNGEKLRKYYRAVCEITKKGQMRLEVNAKFPIILDSLIYPKTNTIGYPKRGVSILRGVSKSPMISNENQDKKDLVLMDLEIIT
jgi:hypothetical protein